MGAEQSTICCQCPARDEVCIERAWRQHVQGNFTEVPVPCCGHDPAPSTAVEGGEGLNFNVRPVDPSLSFPKDGRGPDSYRTRSPENQRESPPSQGVLAAADVQAVQCAIPTASAASLERAKQCSPDAHEVRQSGRDDAPDCGSKRGHSSAQRCSTSAIPATSAAPPLHREGEVADCAEASAARLYAARCIVKAHEKTCARFPVGRDETELQPSMDVAGRGERGERSGDLGSEVAGTTSSRGNTLEAAAAASVLTADGASVSSGRRASGERKGGSRRRSGSDGHGSEAITPSTHIDSDQDSPHTPSDQDLLSARHSRVPGLAEREGSDVLEDGGEDELETALRNLGAETSVPRMELLTPPQVYAANPGAGTCADGLLQQPHSESIDQICILPMPSSSVSSVPSQDSGTAGDQVSEEARAWNPEQAIRPELEMVSAVAVSIPAIDESVDECDNLGLGIAEGIHTPRISSVRRSLAREWPKGPPVVLHPDASEPVSAPVSLPSGGDAQARVMSADEMRRGNTLEQAVRAGLEQQRRASPGPRKASDTWHAGHHSGLGAHIVGAALGALTHGSRTGAGRPAQRTGSGTPRAVARADGGRMGPKVVSATAAPAVKSALASSSKKRASDYSGY